MDTDSLFEIAQQHAYGSLDLDVDPELGFAGVRALRELADFCEAYQVRKSRAGGYSWARIASWAGISPQALHKKYAKMIDAASTERAGGKGL
jgi:hypothetical protein